MSCLLLINCGEKWIKWITFVIYNVIVSQQNYSSEPSLPYELADTALLKLDILLPPDSSSSSFLPPDVFFT